MNADLKTPSLPHATPSRSLVVAANFVTFSIVCGLLYWGRVVAIPLALAILLSFMLNPVVKRLNRWRIPKTVAVILTVILAMGALIGTFALIGGQLASLAGDLPKYRENITRKVTEVRSWMKGGMVERLQNTVDTVAKDMEKEAETAKTKEKEKSFFSSLAEEEKPRPVYITTRQKVFDLGELSMLLPFIDPLTTAGLVFLLVVLILLRWEDLRNRLISFSGGQNLSVATKALDDAGNRITRYLGMQLIINGSFGLCIYIGLLLLGVPFAALWGVCAALFRYIPYVGPAASALLVIGFSLVTSEDWTQPLWVIGLVIGLELVSNNFLEPWLYGSSLGMSEVGVILSAVAWTFLWGPVGLVLATPLTVCLVVLGQYVPAFSIFSRLLGDKPVLDAPFRFYQRLLARDQLEARDLARKELDLSSCQTGIDSLFIPACALAARDESSHLLEPGDREHLAENFKTVFDSIVEEVAEKEQCQDKVPDPETVTPLSPVPVVVWPVGPFSEDAVHMLAWTLRNSPADLKTLSSKSMVGEVGESIAAESPVAVCLVVLAEAEAKRVRQSIKWLRARDAAIKIIVADLSAASPRRADLDAANKEAGATAITHTIEETRASLLPYVQDAAQVERTPERTG